MFDFDGLHLHLHPHRGAVASAGLPGAPFAAMRPASREYTVAGANVATDVASWSRAYRDALPWAGITFPARELRREGVAAAVRRGGHCVDVHSADELGLVVAAGIAPARIVMHDDDGAAGSIRCAVMVGAGRFVIGCREQASVLAGCAAGPQRVLVDMSAEGAMVIDGVLGDPRLRLIGLHARLGSSTATANRYAEVVAALIAQMAHVRREHDVLLTRVSIAGGVGLSPRPLNRRSLVQLDSAIEDAVDDACARHRFPRPVLVLAPAL